MEKFDVVIVGSGLVGSALAWELTRLGAHLVVLESSSEIAAGASRSNSGLLCTGFDSTPQTLETRMILEQGKRWRPIFDGLGIPYRIPGALVLANDQTEAERLPGLAENAQRNGIETILLERSEIREREPGVSAVAGLLVPGEAITDPYEAVRGLLSVVADVRLGWPVQRLSNDKGVTVVSGPAGSIAGRFIVNCAGLYADDVAGDGSFRITPRRGEFLVFGEASARRVNHILLPLPTGETKGVILFPTVYDQLCAGPSAVDQNDKDDWRARPEELQKIRSKAISILPELESVEPTASWAGLRPVGHPRNYYLEWSEKYRSLLNVAGIRSTGLSSCLGLSQLIAGLLIERGLKLKESSALPTPPRPDAPAIPWWERLNRLRG